MSDETFDDEPEATQLSESELPGAPVGADEPAADGDPEASRILGDFELLSELGRGGMGVVYEARQISLKRRVALKVLPPALGLSPQARKRFQREAQAAAALHHTNIVPVHAIGEQEGHHFYAMELIEGQPLDGVLHDLVEDGSNALMEVAVTVSSGEARPRVTTPRTRADDTSLSDASAAGREWFDTVARLVSEVADALEYAHGRGVIHRDIKPANLMFSREGRLCITDFGLARMLQEPGVTISGSFMGTPAYMSPEQIASGRAGLDHRTDIYSLGAVLYELLTLQRPFPGESREEILAGVLTKDPRPPRRFNGKIPLDLETICLKAIEKDPDRRYATAADFAQDLRQYLQRGLITAQRASLARRTWKLIHRHPTAATAVGLGLVFSLVVAGIVWVSARHFAENELERLVLDGELAREAGLHDLSLTRAEEALAIAPQNASARLLQARARIQLLETRDVVQDARQRLSHEPDDWVAHLILAFAGTNDYDPDPTIDAETHVRALERLAPESAEAYFMRAQIAGGPRERLELLDRGLEISPRNARALNTRIDTRIQLKDFQSAFLDCERLIIARERSPQGHRMKALVLGALHDYAGAFETIERAIAMTNEERQKTDAAWNYQARAEIHWARGEVREAIADVSRALALRPHFIQALDDRAGYWNDAGEYEKAVADALRGIDVDPDYRWAHFRLFLAYWNLKERDRLRVSLEALIELAENWRDPRARAQAHSTVSHWYRMLGDSEEALAQAGRAVELDPTYPWGYWSRLRARQRLEGDSGIQEDCDKLAALEFEDLDADLRIAGYLGSVCKRPAQAIESTTRIIERAPHWADPYRKRGELHLERGEHAEALADANKAIELAPAWGGPYQVRGLVHKDKRRYDQALADAARAIELEPDNLNATFARAQVYMDLERFEEALVDLDWVLERLPAALNARWFQSVALLRLGREEEALAAADKAIEYRPGFDEAIRNRAQLLEWMGRIDASRASAEQAVEHSPKEAWNYLCRARALLDDAGGCDLALADLARARELAPDDPTVASKIAWEHASALHGRCPDGYDGGLALDLAGTAVEDQPGSAETQLAWGMASYRHGRYREAREALRRAAELRVPKPDPRELFAVAMAEWKLRNHAEARRRYDRAVARTRETYPRCPEYLRLQEEAGRLLGL
jgi:serine/threonine protein kinase/predicted Zn-dependent protease